MILAGSRAVVVRRCSLVNRASHERVTTPGRGSAGLGPRACYSPAGRRINPLKGGNESTAEAG